MLLVMLLWHQLIGRNLYDFVVTRRLRFDDINLSSSDLYVREAKAIEQRGDGGACVFARSVEDAVS
jgi:hypothetical protein